MAKRAYSVLPTLYGYIRTSRRLIAGEPGNDPDTQRLHLADADVPAANLYQDLGVSGSTGTTTRQGWCSLNSHMHPGDVLVVASADRVGPPRRYLRWQGHSPFLARLDQGLGHCPKLIQCLLGGIPPSHAALQGRDLRQVHPAFALLRFVKNVVQLMGSTLMCDQAESQYVEQATG